MNHDFVNKANDTLITDSSENGVINGGNNKALYEMYQQGESNPLGGGGARKSSAQSAITTNSWGMNGDHIEMPPQEDS